MLSFITYIDSTKIVMKISWSLIYCVAVKSQIKKLTVSVYIYARRKNIDLTESNARIAYLNSIKAQWMKEYDVSIKDKYSYIIRLSIIIKIF